MKRSTVVGARLLTLLIGLVLLASAAFAVCWQLSVVLANSDELSASWTRSLGDQGWYPWALGAGGIVVGLICLRAMFAQTRHHKVGDLRVSTSEPATTLGFDLGAVLSAASDELESCLGVRSVHTSAGLEGSNTVCSFSVTIDPRADLGLIVGDCERVMADLNRCVARDDLRCRAVVSSTSRKSSLARVG